MQEPSLWKRAFVASDLQLGQRHALAHAMRLALANQGTVHLTHVHRPDRPVDWTRLPTVRDLLTQWKRITADADLAAFQRLGVKVEMEAIASLDLIEPLIAEVHRIEPDLVILPTHGRRGLERLREPSVAESFARELDVPTLFLGEKARPFVDPDSGSISLRRILVPIDRADDARHAIHAATTLVASYGAAPAEFILVHVGDKSAVPALFVPEDDVRWTWRLDVRHGPLEQEIVSAIDAHDVDVVVMTTHGHDGLVDSLRGSHTEIVMRHAAVPVLSVPVA